MTMTGNIGGVPWYRCAEATRLFDAWVALVDAPRPDAFDGDVEYARATIAAWLAYQTHLWGCDDCKIARRNG